jgi:hypothetical protein
MPNASRKRHLSPQIRTEGPHFVAVQYERPPNPSSTAASDKSSQSMRVRGYLRISLSFSTKVRAEQWAGRRAVGECCKPQLVADRAGWRFALYIISGLRNISRSLARA